MEHTLGLEAVEEGNTATSHHIRYNCGPLELELVSGGTTWATRPKPRQGQPDIALIPSFKVDNISRLAAYLNGREIPLTQVFEQGWVASFLFFDPERNLWQVSETRTEPAVATEKAAIITALWLATENFSAQVAFYRDVLGLPVVSQPTQPRPITLEAELYHQENPVNSLDRLESPQNEKSDQALTLEAVFFTEGVRLALSPGGTCLEGNAARVWGQDTAFLPGFQTNNLTGLVARLHAAGVQTSDPFPHFHRGATNGSRPPRPDFRQTSAGHHVTQAIRFTDPEGNPWQIFE
jgi:catechol 2,3-dioxygenase-like lactoylglutathione lyase family enzyme